MNDAPIPYFAVGNQELKHRPEYRKGMRVVRQSDQKVFELGFGTCNGVPSELITFITDDGVSFVAGVGGRLLTGFEPLAGSDWLPIETLPPELKHQEHEEKEKGVYTTAKDCDSLWVFKPTHWRPIL